MKKVFQTNSLFCCILFLTTMVSAQNRPEVFIQQGHTNFVYSVAYSPDGKWLASGSEDKTVKLWNPKTGKEIRTFKGHTREVTRVCFSKNGQFIFSSGKDNTIWRWSLINDSLSKIILKESFQIFDVSPDDQLLAIGIGRVLKIFDVSTGNLVHSFDNLSNGILSVAFSPDGQHLAAGFSSNNIDIWELSSWKKIRSLEGHRDRVISLVFSPNGRILASGSMDAIIKLWDTAEGNELYTLLGHESKIASLAFSPDGRLLASASAVIYNKGDQFMLWDVGSGRKIKSFSGHNYDVESLAFSPDGTTIASGSTDNTIKIWNTASGKEIRTLKGYLTDRFPGQVVFSPDGQYFATSISTKVTLWRMSGKFEVKEFSGNEKGINSVAFSPDGRFIASGGSDKTIRLWDTRSGKQVRMMNVVYDKTKNGTLYAIAANLWFSPDGQYLAASIWDEENSVRIFEVSSGNEILRLRGHSRSVLCTALSPDGRYLASGSSDKTIRIWDPRTGNELKRIAVNYMVFDLDFSKDGKILASGGSDNTIKLWDVNTGNLLQVLSGHTDGVNGVHFSPDNQRIASSDFSGFIKIWDTQSGKELHTLTGHSSSVNSIAFSPSGNQLISTSKDNTIRLWDVRSAKEIVAFSNFGEDQIVIMTPDHYYLSSKGALNNINISYQNKEYSFDQLDLKYNRPDIVLERLGIASPELIQAYRKAYEKRLRKMGFNPKNFEKEFRLNAPEVKIKSGEDIIKTSQPNYTLTFAAEDKLFNLDRYFVTVNGVPLFGLQGKKFTTLGKKFEQTVTLPLSSGVNTIKISALNQKGVESLAEKIEVDYNPASPVKPNLYVIAIGVSSFNQSDYNLTYADKDAADIINLFKKQSSKYGEVRTFLLQNQQATVETILDLRSELEKTSPDDQVVVFFASHGLLDNDLDYYLATHDIDFSQPQIRGLRYDRLEALLDGIPARKKLLLIDACHSGEIDKEDSQLIADSQTMDSQVKSRGFKAVKKTGTTIDLKTSFELMKELFADLRRNSGTIVISSASGAEYAYETQTLRNGVFTFSVVEGLQQGKADLNGNRKVYASELMTYLGNRVKELTGGKQNPTTRSENIEYDFNIWDE